jgi:hypothetical protein
MPLALGPLVSLVPMQASRCPFGDHRVQKKSLSTFGRGFFRKRKLPLLALTMTAASQLNPALGHLTWLSIAT